jgi:tRNA U34 5-carboxymethylaminomethyl modifying enzyme MnmG/GidA
MTQQLGVITDTMVTKDDLKEELKKFPTRAEVKDIVREETADIRDEQLRQGGLLEDLDHKVSAIAPLVVN